MPYNVTTLNLGRVCTYGNLVEILRHMRSGCCCKASVAVLNLHRLALVVMVVLLRLE
jgi:hypothetical protein